MIRTLLVSVLAAVLFLTLSSCRDETFDTVPPQASPAQTEYSPAPSGESRTKHSISVFHPVVCNNLLLGGFKEGEWISAQDLPTNLIGDELYKLYDFNGHIGYGFGGTVLPDYNSEPYAEFVDGMDLNFFEPRAESPSEAETLDFVAISCDWDCMPRKAIPQSVESEIYIDIVREILVEKGLELETDDINIIQNYRVDLDSDGVEEVVIYAESLPLIDNETSVKWRYSRRKGSYSILLLRRYADGKVDNIILDESIFTEEIGSELELDNSLRFTFGILAFLDLNGDGELELLTCRTYYEGYEYTVYKLINGAPVLVLGNGWGV